MDNPSIERQEAAGISPLQDDPRRNFSGERIVVLPRAVISAAMNHSLLGQWLPTDIGYFPHATCHYGRRPQGSEQTIFIFCVKGAGWCELEGNHHDIQSGDVLVLPPRLAHSYGADENHPWTIYWFHAIGSNVTWFLRELGINKQHPKLANGVIPRQLDLFEEALGVLESGYAHRQLLYSAQILQHLVSTLVWRRNRANRPQATPEAAIARTIAYMEQHLDQSLRIAALASLANLSCSHYSVLFHRHTGYAPMDYFKRLRMHRACQLLDTTNLSVQQVSTQLGYEDSLYFSRLFKTINGVPPSQYRKQHKG